MSLTKNYGQEVINKLEKAINTQEKNIKKAAELMYYAKLNNKRVFFEGSGHSHMLGEELYSRAGGYVDLTPMLEPELMLHEHPMKSTYIERLSGYADILLNLYKVQKDDLIFVVSNSGRNALPVEMALGAKEKGASVIAITNVTHSSMVTSRHSSGKKLMDIADVVIDNCGDYGDAFFEVDNFPYKTGASSTTIGAFIVQAIVIELVNMLVKKV